MRIAIVSRALAALAVCAGASLAGCGGTSPAVFDPLRQALGTNVLALLTTPVPVDSGAKGVLGLAVSAEVVYFDNTGRYTGRFADLIRVATTLPSNSGSNCVPVSGPCVVSVKSVGGPGGYSLTALSQTGATYTLTHQPGGRVLRTCTPSANPAEHGCNHGTW